MRIFACVLAFVWLLPGLAAAQVDVVDPDAKRPAPRRGNKAAAPVDPDDGPTVNEETVDETPDESDGTNEAPTPASKSRSRKERLEAEKAAEKQTAREAERVLPKESPRKEPPRVEPPKLVVKTVSDADLKALWLAWRQANASHNTEAEAGARKALLSVRQLIGARNLELWSVGLLRAAQVWQDAGDSGAAVEIGLSASQLAPDLPAAWFQLAKLYFASDPSGVGRYMSALREGVGAQFRDPRYFRPLLADLASVVVVSFVITAGVVLFVLLLRRGGYFLYDFHFFFPRAAARWQTTAMAVLLLLLPLVFRMGVVPTLLGFFAAVTLYLPLEERVVGAVLIGLLGGVPWVGGKVVEYTTFADTTAEGLYRIERDGPDTEPLVQRFEKLAAEDKVGFAERFVLGHFHLNRGHLEQSVEHLKGALAQRPEDVPSRVALAKALFLQGDLENSKAILEKVREESPSAVALYNLSRVYHRRIQIYGESGLAELPKVGQYLADARQLDPSLAEPADGPVPPKELVGNLELLTLPLSSADLLAQANGEEAARRVRTQLAHLLVGDVPPLVGLLYPLVAALGVLALGFLARPIGAAKVCARCGRPVSRRGDPDVSPGSTMCTQCVNVFARKGVVAASLKVRKQLEVARYEGRKERVSTVLGVLWSGMGHVFAGATIRGTLYGFLFAAAIAGVVMRWGVVRAPYDGFPVSLRVAPLALLFLAVYGLSLFGLRRRD